MAGYGVQLEGSNVDATLECIAENTIKMNLMKKCKLIFILFV
ncbi:hypothetical protein HanPSC8_Chr14g0629281 [Helianthus annuus]|nr:hypothetical protein HanPSC8_Chr14g0629281 [Helianthus annuus]